MNLIVFTRPGCKVCENTKKILKQKEIEFKEVNVDESDENMQLAEQYEVSVLGTIIDLDTNSKIKLTDIKE